MTSFRGTFPHFHFFMFGNYTYKGSFKYKKRDCTLTVPFPMYTPLGVKFLIPSVSYAIGDADAPLFPLLAW